MDRRSRYEYLIGISLPHLDEDSGLSDDYELLCLALSAVLKYAGCRAYIVRLVYDAFHAV